MELVDTHCHIQSAGNSNGERSTSQLWAQQADLTVAELITNAKAANVTKLICVGCDVADSQLAVACAQQHATVWASIGIHPHEATSVIGDERAWTTFAALAQQPKVVAVGECGLDYFYNHSPKADQIAVLHQQLALAQDHKLPVIFHVREAFADFWPIYNQYPGVRGVLHSFTDSLENMDRAVEAGLYIGVNGIATFAKQDTQRQMYAAIPIERLVLETDAPFLTPTPYRGTVNEPKHIMTVASYLAISRNIDVSELAIATTINAQNLFGLK